MPRLRGEQIFIGKISVGSPKSTVVVSVFDNSGDELINKLETGMLSPRNLYEIRYDLFEKKSPEDLVFLLKDLDQVDVDYIFTYRTSNPEEFQKMYSIAIDKLAPAVDMDINMYKGFQKKPVDGKMMLSFHTSNHLEIPKALSDMKKFDPDLYKIASDYRNDLDFFTDLVSLHRFKQAQRKPFSFIPMGKNNSFLRVVSAYSISDIVYARSETETAEGQMAYDDYVKIFKYF